MTTLFAGTIMLSIIHGLIPSHWLPVLAMKEKYAWSYRKTTHVAIWAALAHSLSTFLLGVFLGVLSLSLAENITSYTQWVVPALLVVLGLFFIVQHHRHHNFHFPDKQKLENADSRQVISLLILMMFLSPCLEIEAYFIMAGAYGWPVILGIGGVYTIVSTAGISLWVAMAQKGLHKLNWHKLEHSVGLISGIVLIITGFASFFMH